MSGFVTSIAIVAVLVFAETVVPIAVILTLALAVETARWFLRPEARRLRVIRKIGGRR